MWKKMLSALVVLMLFAGGLFADVAGTIVRFEKDKLVVKVGDKERTFTLDRKTHVHDVNGDEVEVKDRAKHLKKGVKIEIEEKSGKVVEINIKK